MLRALLGSIVSGFFGSGLGQITGALKDAYQAKLTAQTTEAKLEADQNIATLEAQRAVLIAEASSGGFQSWIRPLFAIPFVIYNGKLVLWDKVLGWGSTDPLSDSLFQIEMIVISAYFLSRGAEKVARIVATR